MKFSHLLVALTVVFAVLRFTIPFPGVDMSTASVYKDAAHLYVGLLFGAAIVSTVAWGRKSIWLWILAFGLTGIEVFAFFNSKG